jgi:hypothetical protein
MDRARAGRLQEAALRVQDAAPGEDHGPGPGLHDRDDLDSVGEGEGVKTCKCGKPMEWGTVQGTDTKVPLDPRAPCYEIIERKPDGEIVIVRAKAMVSHFATCPKAAEFSGGKK